MIRTDGSDLPIEPFTAHIVSRLIDALGPVGAAARAEVRLDPVEQWDARDGIAIVRELRARTRDEFLGLGADRCRAGSYRLLIDLAVRCGNLRDALQMGFRYLALATTAIRLELVEDGAEAAIRIAQAPSERDPTRVLTDWSLVVWHKLPQWLIGAPIEFDRVEIGHGPDIAVEAFAGMFGDRCRFDAGGAGLVFARAYLDRSIVKTPLHARQMQSRPQGYTAQPGGIASSLGGQIQEIWRHDLEHGQPLSTIEQLARQFGVSGQTVRRRLHDEGVSYRSLKAATRFDLKADALTDASLSEDRRVTAAMVRDQPG